MSRSRPVSSTARSGSTSPSYGQPNTVDTYARTETFAARATGITSSNAASVSAIDLLTFFLLCVSDADRKTAISFIPAASAESSPRRFGTSALIRTPGGRCTPRATSAASASCGIHLGDTKLVISMSPDARADQRVDEAQLVGGRDLARLVLQAVARPDLVDRDLGRQLHGRVPIVEP